MEKDEIEQAFRQAKGRWIGCDWPTEFGETKLNLHCLQSSQALLLARATSGIERADWQSAFAWLAKIEQATKEAEDEAIRCLALAQSGKLQEALAHAQRACAIEAEYHDRLVWEPICKAIEEALLAPAS